MVSKIDVFGAIGLKNGHGFIIITVLLARRQSTKKVKAGNIDASFVSGG